MSLRLRSALTGALACALLVPLSALDAAAGQQGHQHAPAAHRGVSMLALDARGSTEHVRDGLGVQRANVGSGFTGSDGLFYEWAPLVVSGFNDDLFLGQDFDRACSDGKRFTKAMKKLAKLAKVIEAAGKRVVFTVAPNKSSVNGADVDWSTVPHGSCGLFGLTDQNNTLDNFKDPRYLPIRKSLSDDPREVYWKTDAHWTTVGSSVYATALAGRLNKKLARRQNYSPTIRTELGDIYQLLGLPGPAETAPALLPADGVTVTTDPGSDGFDPVNAVSFQHSWTSTPASRTLGGQTLVIGDSFTYLGLEAIRPLFAKGTFMWIQPNMLGKMVAGIAGADTVAIEIVQRFVSSSILATKTFRKAVQAQLKH